MSDRISIPMLRLYVGARPAEVSPSDDWLAAHRDTLLALVEAVEAAQRYLVAPDDHPDLGDFFLAWLKAQKRFDFGEDDQGGDAA